LIQVTNNSNTNSSNSYRVVVAADDSAVSKKAIEYAINLCGKLKIPYQLDVLYATGLNPTTGTTALGLLYVILVKHFTAVVFIYYFFVCI
jgi:nucleotide-binding universal stress UspA family protein